MKSTFITNPVQDFTDAMRNSGLTPPDVINDDGGTHRFSTKPGNKNGWYFLHTDGVPLGQAGDWSVNGGEPMIHWSAKSDKQMTQAERDTQRALQTIAREQRDAEKAQRHTAAARIAETIWAASTSCTEHPYLQRKGVQAHGAKVIDAQAARAIDGSLSPSLTGLLLVIPMRNSAGILRSLQFITADGTKRPLTGGQKQGCYYAISKSKDRRLVVVEGFATAGSVHQCTGDGVAVAFDSGNLAVVAMALAEKYPELTIVIGADDDFQTDGNPGMAAAQAAAKAVNGLVAVPDFGSNRPDGATDFNDLHQISGASAVQACFAANHENQPKIHPLARFVSIDGTAKPPRWVIPGFIGHGVTVIAGAGGVGKTTAVLPLALTAAGLHGDDLMPRQWRHVVYVTEDVEQAMRILSGLVLHGGLGITLESVRERFHLVEAVRLDPAFVANVGSTYREQFTRTVEGVEVLPLVVLDTKSAILALENENDNSEASRMMAALKQGFERLPVWLVAHVAKAGLSRADALSSRGASACGDDATQTLFFLKEGETRYLVLGKIRFEARWQELEITSYTAQTVEPDEFGNLETVVLRWGISSPAQQSRKEATEQATAQQRDDDEASLRQDIRDAVDAAWQTGNPLSRAGVRAKVRRKGTDVLAMLENLLNERWLHEVTVPSKDRTNNKRAAFLVNLSTKEHEAVLSGHGLPAKKTAIPASWQKEPIPFVPAPASEVMECDHE